MTPARRTGALLLLVGGLLGVVLPLAGAFAISFSPSIPELITGGLTSLPSASIGAGLIAIGVSSLGRGRFALIVAGALYLATVAVNIVQMATDSPFGPLPSQLATLVSFAAVVVAAALLLSNDSLRGPARWAMAIPAAGIVLFFVGVYLPLLGAVPVLGWLVFALPTIGFAIAGALLLRRTQPQGAPA
jgi:hypothetical protein